MGRVDVKDRELQPNKAKGADKDAKVMGILESMRSLWRLFSRSERRLFVLLLGLIVSYALLQTASVASVMPFFAVVSNPQVVETNRYLNWAYTTFGFTSYEAFLVVLGLAVFSFIVVSNAYRLFVKYVKIRFAKMRGHEFSRRLLGKYLARPYVFFLNENSSDLSKNVLSEVKQLVSGFLLPLLDFLTYLLSGLSIVVLLVLVNPYAAAVVAGGFLLIYGGIYMLVRLRLQTLGKKRLEANRERYKSSLEAMSGIKDVKLLGKERHFLERYAKPSKKMARHQIAIEIIGRIPNKVVTVFVHGGIILAITAMIALLDDFAAFIPVIAVYVFAGNKLLPAFKHLFRDMAKVTAAQPVLALMFDHLTTADVQQLPKKRAPQLEPLPFRHQIRLEEVRFRYPGSEVPAVEEISLTIPKNTSVGFVGPTGCGKTTLVDIILGLLTPEAGRLSVDDVPVTEANLRNWQGLLGYVPQFIYLSDDSVARNIAFGIPDEEINMEAVRRAAEIANLREYIETELPHGFDTQLGERGNRLSGGQRQRLGIARALYHDPEVLVMDEATSALDGITEQVVMDAIDRLGGTKTIILIAHRLSTLAGCNTIYVLESGRVVDSGSYRDLMQSNRRFQEMARAAH